MASMNYDSFWDDLYKGNIVPSSDTFYGLLVTSSYTPDKGGHAKRSDITNEVTGTGYTAGGAACSFAISLDTTNHRADITITAPSWPGSTIANARGLVIYKRRGGAATADNLVTFIDFGSDVSSTAATFTVSVATPLRIQN